MTKYFSLQNVIGYLLKRKTVIRALTNCAIHNVPTLTGKILDVGGVPNAEYHKLITTANATIETLNIDTTVQPTYVANAHTLPLSDHTYDAALCLYVLEHVKEPHLVMKELARVVRPSGIILIAVPFLHRIHAHPHDYYRFSEEAVRTLFSEQNVELMKVVPLTFGPFTSAIAQLTFLPRVLFIPFFLLTYVFDVIIRKRLKKQAYEWPLGYVAWGKVSSSS